MHYCMRITSTKIDDDKMRPGSNTPDKHWAYMLIDLYSDYDTRRKVVIYPEGIKIVWSDTGIGLDISPIFWQQHEDAFIAVSKFVVDNGLAYEFLNEMQMCDSCPGHKSCISNQHRIRSEPVRFEVEKGLQVFEETEEN